MLTKKDQRIFKMLQNIIDFCNYWWFRYLMVTELYMVEKWERVTIRKYMYEANELLRYFCRNTSHEYQSFRQLLVCMCISNSIEYLIIIRVYMQLTTKISQDKGNYEYYHNDWLNKILFTAGLILGGRPTPTYILTNFFFERSNANHRGGYFPIT